MLTLRMARVNCRMTEKEAADKAGIDVRTLRRWEKDCGGAELFRFKRLLAVYKVGINHIYCGSEDEGLELLRSAVDAS